MALKSDIFTFYTCEINKGDIWLQLEKLKKESPLFDTPGGSGAPEGLANSGEKGF